MNYSSYNGCMRKSKYWEPEIVRVWLKEGTTYDTLYNDGVIKRFDILTLAEEYPIFNALRDRKLFLKGKADLYGVIWNEDIDISGWAAYNRGVDVTKEYSNIEQYLVGHKLKQTRINHNVSQVELSKMTDIDQATISKIENGNMNLSIKTIMKIVNVLGAKITLDIK